MSNTSGQKVVVICDFSEHTKDVIVHGTRMADVLRKELCLTAICANKNQKTGLQEKLIQASSRIKALVPNIVVSYLILNNSLHENMGRLVDDYEAVLLVLHQTDAKWAMKAFRQSSIAYLFVNGDDPHFLNYKSVLVPVDFRKASKETSLWASYFGRFNKAQIQLIYAHDTDREQAAKLSRNLQFFQKFLSSMHVRFQSIAGKSTSWGICDEALRRSEELQADVMIFSGSSVISILDLLIGLPEKKILRKAGKLPVVMINPRKDICVLCD